MRNSISFEMIVVIKDVFIYVFQVIYPQIATKLAMCHFVSVTCWKPGLEIDDQILAMETIF